MWRVSSTTLGARGLRCGCVVCMRVFWCGCVVCMCGACGLWYRCVVNVIRSVDVNCLVSKNHNNVNVWPSYNIFFHYKRRKNRIDSN